jgi:hypothetical protein
MKKKKASKNNLLEKPNQTFDERRFPFVIQDKFVFILFGLILLYL